MLSSIITAILLGFVLGMWMSKPNSQKLLMFVTLIFALFAGAAYFHGYFPVELLLVWALTGKNGKILWARYNQVVNHLLPPPLERDRQGHLIIDTYYDPKKNCYMPILPNWYQKICLSMVGRSQQNDDRFSQRRAARRQRA